MRPKALRSLDLQLGKLSKVLKSAYSDSSTVWDYEYDGVVQDVAKSGSQFTVTVKTRRGMQPGDKVCMSPDHEVLTTTGFKPITDVSVDDLVYSIDPATEIISVKPVVNTFTFDHTGPMYSLETEYVSMLVTDNHKIPAKIRKSGGHEWSRPFELHQAKDLAGKRYRLMAGGLWDAPSTCVTVLPGVGTKGQLMPHVDLTDIQFCMLLGAFLSEGTVVWHEPSGTYGLDISQYKQPNVEIFERAFEGFPVRACRTPDGFRLHSKVLAEHFKAMGHSHEKFIPTMVFGMSHAALSTLYRWLMWGDGSVGKTNRFYYTSSPRLRDDFQRLCLLLGKGTKFETRTPAE